MKILFLTHRVPYPPNRGDRIRSYHILRHLAERAEVDLACLADEPVADSCREVLQLLCDRVEIVPQGRRSRWFRAVVSLARGRSATEGLFWSPELTRTLHDWASDRDYDLVLVYCSSMYQYSAVGRLLHSPCLVDLVDVDSQKWMDYARSWPRTLRWLYRLEGSRVRRLEREVAGSAQATVVVSDSEASLLREICPRGQVHVVSNGVDLAGFRPESNGGAPPPRRDEANGHLNCVFAGALDYWPNVDGLQWFCREVWPAIYRRIPQARLMLVGRHPSSQVRRLPQQPGVELVGEVPDVLPYLWRSRLVVVPLRIARGIQNKVLEALAAGKPVIASTQSLTGLDVAVGEHVWRADSPAEWIEGIGRLLTDDAECERLGAAGRKFVCRNHCWFDCLQSLDDVLDQSVRNRLVDSPLLPFVEVSRYQL